MNLTTRNLFKNMCTPYWIWLFIFFGWSNVMFGQTPFKAVLPAGWHLLDNEETGYYGISLDKAYRFIKEKQMQRQKVVVAILDSGIDTMHEDLKNSLWRNPREIPGNGYDDDNNGYVDDIYGWNFLGNPSGENVKVDSYEYMRQFYLLQHKYEYVLADEISPDERPAYERWQLALKTMKQVKGVEQDTTNLKRMIIRIRQLDDSLQRVSKKNVYYLKDLQFNSPASESDKFIKSLFDNNPEMDSRQAMDNNLKRYEIMFRKVSALYQEPPNYRKKVTLDNENIISKVIYGNGDVMVDNPTHGTHVAGIIAADRVNDKGAKGIADHVLIMSIRIVPDDGDEHDKDIAMGIRYAVDNGARIINMSFGKALSPNKHFIDDAVRYAEKRGVLIIHAAGNEAKDIDKEPNYPNPLFDSVLQRANNWITVGASSNPGAEKNFQSYTASFSNYGKKNVDVFAPGTMIYSCLPGNRYSFLQGTSMAAPIVSGVAALLFSCFPDLTPNQVKTIIENSSVKLPLLVKKPGTGELVKMSEISSSGGILNAYNAIVLAFKGKSL